MDIYIQHRSFANKLTAHLQKRRVVIMQDKDAISLTNVSSDMSISNNDQGSQGEDGDFQVVKKRRRTKKQRDLQSSRTSPRDSRVQSPCQSFREPQTEGPTSRPFGTFMIVMNQKWSNETEVLLQLTKHYKGLELTKRQTSTYRNLLVPQTQKAAETLKSIKILNGKTIHFEQLDASRKITTGILLKVPHMIEPSDIMELVTAFKVAERMTVWDNQTNKVCETMSMKIQWEGSTMPKTVSLGILAGILHHKKVQSSTSTMLQVPEVSAHIQNLSEQPRCLRSLWRETPHQSLCRKEEQKGGHHAEMQQLSRGSQYSKQQVSRSEGVNKEDPTSDKTGRSMSFFQTPNRYRNQHSSQQWKIFP